jgi:hypothetical protein
MMLVFLRRLFGPDEIKSHVGWNKDVADNHYLTDTSVPIALALAGVIARCRDELIDLYLSERFCLDMDKERVKTELAHLWLPPLVEFRAQVERLKVNGLIRERPSVSIGLGAMESLVVQAICGAVALVATACESSHCQMLCYSTLLPGACSTVPY